MEISSTNVEDCQLTPKYYENRGTVLSKEKIREVVDVVIHIFNIGFVVEEYNGKKKRQKTTFVPQSRLDIEIMKTIK